MERTDLTQYDEKPKAMVNYLRYNGPHFNQSLLDFAVSKMTKRGGIKIIPMKNSMQGFDYHNRMHITTLTMQYRLFLTLLLFF